MAGLLPGLFFEVNKLNFSRMYELTALECFRIIATEFDEVPDETVEKGFMVASMFIDEEAYAEAAPVAIALMTAHIMSLPGGINTNSTSTSIVKSKREGDLSITYDSVSRGDSSWLGQSVYGEMLKMLQRRRGMLLGMLVRGPVVGPCDDPAFIHADFPGVLNDGGRG